MHTSPKAVKPVGAVFPSVQGGAVPHAPGPLPAQPANDTRSHPPKSAGPRSSETEPLTRGRKGPCRGWQGPNPRRQRGPHQHILGPKRWLVALPTTCIPWGPLVPLKPGLLCCNPRRTQAPPWAMSTSVQEEEGGGKPGGPGTCLRTGVPTTKTSICFFSFGHSHG